VHVEVILMDDSMIQPFIIQRTEVRHKHSEQKGKPRKLARKETIPLEVEDLFKMETEEQLQRNRGRTGSKHSDTDEDRKHVCVSDMRSSFCTEAGDRPLPQQQHTPPLCQETHLFAGVSALQTTGALRHADAHPAAVWQGLNGTRRKGRDLDEICQQLRSNQGTIAPEAHGLNQQAASSSEGEPLSPSKMSHTASLPTEDSSKKLNAIIYGRSKRAQLVVMNLPDLWGTGPEEVRRYMTYCDALTSGLDRVLFVHSTGHEIFDLSL